MPVYSLYSEVREPSAEMLEGLDALVVDIQDVGTRVYTFIYTVANCMRAAARHGVPVIVCDRPNPINGVDVEGNLLDERYTSFVGQFPIPMRHGMTVGEIALLFNTAFDIGADVHVVHDGGLAPRDVLRGDRAAVCHAVAEHSDRRHAPWSIRARCCSRARSYPRGAAPRVRSN